jgi:hypothetical protein
VSFALNQPSIRTTGLNLSADFSWATRDNRVDEKILFSLYTGKNYSNPRLFIISSLCVSTEDFSNITGQNSPKQVVQLPAWWKQI